MSGLLEQPIWSLACMAEITTVERHSHGLLFFAILFAILVATIIAISGDASAEVSEDYEYRLINGDTADLEAIIEAETEEAEENTQAV
jgi:hypothetical protein